MGGYSKTSQWPHDRAREEQREEHRYGDEHHHGRADCCPLIVDEVREGTIVGGGEQHAFLGRHRGRNYGGQVWRASDFRHRLAARAGANRLRPVLEAINFRLGEILDLSSTDGHVDSSVETLPYLLGPSFGPMILNVVSRACAPPAL